MSPQDAMTSPCGFYAFSVRTRGEIAIAASLRDKGYEVLLPTYIQERRYSDRIKRVSCALFPGYVFACTSLDSMMGILGTPGTNYVLRSGATVAPLSAQDEQTIRALCHVEGQCEPSVALQMGQRVVIESGPLAGLTGTLANIRNKDRVIVSVESVHRSVMVEIGKAGFRVLEDHPQQLAG